MPDGVVGSYQKLCETILEPIRTHLGKPLRILSGYRDPKLNLVVGGVGDSQHVASPEHSAADWWEPSSDMRGVFDWVRLESGLVWDQLILEHGVHNQIIHVSWSTTPRRQALEGATAGRSSYKSWDVKPLEVSSV